MKEEEQRTTTTGNYGRAAFARQLSSREVAEGAWGSADAHVPSSDTRRLSPQAIGALNASPLPFGFTSKPSPSAPWTRGLLSAFWEPGYPVLPAAHGLAPSTAWYDPSTTPARQDPREGPSLARRTTPRPPEGAASPGGLARSGDFYAGAQPHEVAVTQAMTTKGRRVRESWTKGSSGVRPVIHGPD